MAMYVERDLQRRFMAAAYKFWRQFLRLCCRNIALQFLFFFFFRFYVVLGGVVIIGAAKN